MVKENASLNGMHLFLVKQGGLVVIHFLEDSSHECLADKTASVYYAVLVTKTLQCSMLAFVEQDGYTIFAGLLFHHHSEIGNKLNSISDGITSCLVDERHILDALLHLNFRL